jgi:hypothetical protein
MFLSPVVHVCVSVSVCVCARAGGSMLPGDRFAYCSTLAVYVYEQGDTDIQSLIAAHERSITGLAWSPFDPNILVTCSSDLRLVRWNIRDQVALQSALLVSRLCLTFFSRNKI